MQEACSCPYYLVEFEVRRNDPEHVFEQDILWQSRNGTL